MNIDVLLKSETNHLLSFWSFSGSPHIGYRVGNPMTLFAPTNDAFDLMPTRVKEILENADNTTRSRSARKFNNIHFLLGMKFKHTYFIL